MKYKQCLNISNASVLKLKTKIKKQKNSYKFGRNFVNVNFYATEKMNNIYILHINITDAKVPCICIYYV